MRKNPTLYLAVILPIFVIGAISVVVGLETAYARMTGIRLSSVPALNGILISIPALLLWVPVALMLANGVLFVVPPLRRIAESYAASANLPGFQESQRQLARMALVMGSICVPLIVAGFIL